MLNNLIVNDRVRLFSVFAFIIIVWGFAMPINKIGLDYLTPIWYTAIRTVVGTLTMMVLVLMLNKFTWPDWRDAPLILAIGIIQITLYVVFLNVGLAYIPAGRTAILSYTTPLWIMPLTILFFREKPKLSQWIGFLAGIGGLMLLLCPWEMDWSNRKVIFGAFMALLSSLAWAISILCARYMKWHKSPLELIPWQLLLGTIPILAFAWYKEPLPSLRFLHPAALFSLIYMGVLVAGISYWASLIINKELPSLTVSLGSLSIPLISLVSSIIFLHEPVTILTVSAMALILLGVVCVAI